MVKMNMFKWVADQIASPNRKAMPIMTYPGLAFSGKKVVDMVSNGEIQYECIRQLSARYQTVACAILIMDLSAESEAFGAKIIF